MINKFFGDGEQDGTPRRDMFPTFERYVIARLNHDYPAGTLITMETMARIISLVTLELRNQVALLTLACILQTFALAILLSLLLIGGH